MPHLLSFQFPTWLRFAGTQQQYFRLTLPIIVGVLVVFVLRILAAEEPRSLIKRVMVDDQRQLGYRRFTPARRWFSAFTLSLVQAQSVTTSDAPEEGVIDIGLLDSEAELLEDLGDYAESDEVRSLQELVRHFRREMIAEAGDEHVPGLADTWVGYGSQTVVGLGPLVESETNLRIYNADDLGHQLVARTVTRGIAPVSGSKKRSVAFIAIGADEPTSADVENSLIDLGNAATAGRRRVKLVRALLDNGDMRSVHASTPEILVEAIQGGSRKVGAWGDHLAWTTDLETTRWNHKWSSTTLVSSGPAEELPQEGPALTD